MKNNTKIESQDKENAGIRENSEVDYWSKKYGVSAEELKRTRRNIGIRAKIIEANFRIKKLTF